MEIDLTDIVWPVCVIQCNEALTRLEPGDDLTITVTDPDVVHNIVLLIKSRPDLQFDQHDEFRSFRIRVHRLTANQNTKTEFVQTKTYEKA